MSKVLVMDRLQLMVDVGVDAPSDRLALSRAPTRRVSVSGSIAATSAAARLRLRSGVSAVVAAAASAGAMALSSASLLVVQKVGDGLATLRLQRAEEPTPGAGLLDEGTEPE